MFISTPAKVILSGEHSVVYGHLAIATTISLFTKMKIQQIEGEGRLIINAPQWKIHETFYYREHNPQTELQKVAQILKPNFRDKSFDIHIESDIPSSSGLGSSASLAVGFCQAFNLNISIAKEIENIFHGQQGSGLDVEICHKRGFQSYSKEKGLNQINDIKLNQLLLIDSNLRKSSGTQGTIEKVKKLYEAANGKRIIDRIGQVTEKIVRQGFSNDLVYENHLLLDLLGLCPPEINEIVRICQSHNVPAKMTGGGDGGFCVGFIDNCDNVEKLIDSLKGFPCQIVKIEC